MGHVGFSITSSQGWVVFLWVLSMTQRHSGDQVEKIIQDKGHACIAGGDKGTKFMLGLGRTWQKTVIAVYLILIITDLH